MAHRTTKRAGMYTETGRGSAVANVQKSKGISIVTKYKGLQDNKNDVVAVQDSLADVDNLYIDDNDLLSSRPPVKLFTPVHTLTGISGYTSVRMWNIEGYIFRLLRKWTSEETQYYIICDNKVPVEGEDGDEYIDWTGSSASPIDTEQSIFFAPIEEKIFVYGITGFYYFDTKVYRFKENPVEVDENYIYVPIRYNIVNGVYKEFEALNYLTNAYRNRYHYSLASSIDFGQLNKWVRVYTATDEKYLYQLDTSNYPNKNVSSVLVYPLGNIETPDYYDVVEISNDRGQLTPVIMCWYKETRTIKVSVDGKNYNTISNMPENLLVQESTGGHPFLSRDGSLVICFTNDKIYMANILNLTAVNYMAFEEHNYFENATQPDGTALWSYTATGNITVSAYFMSENVYAYIYQFTGIFNGTAYSNADSPACLLCISHMRNTQRIEVINKTGVFRIRITDLLRMCPRYVDYMYTYNTKTPGPIYLLTNSLQLQLHAIEYTIDNADIDDITGIANDKLLDSNVIIPGSNPEQIYDLFDLQQTTYTQIEPKFVSIDLSESPNYYGTNSADVYFAVSYRRSMYEQLKFIRGYVKNDNSVTVLQRASKAFGSNFSVNNLNSSSFVNVSLSRIYWAFETTSGNKYDQHYYRWTDLPYTPYGNTGTMSSSIQNYIVPVELFAKVVPAPNTNDLWAIKDGRLWTTMLFTDVVIYLDDYVNLSPDAPIYITKYPTHFAALQEYYFSFGNTLAVTATRRNDNNEFLLYLPVDDIQECISEITNLCPISTQYVGVFLEDSIWYAGMEYVNDTLVHKKLMKSKIPFGCKKGTDVLVASDGQSIIFPTYRGIALLGPQDFVATTDPIINYISDNIQNFYLRFYSEVMQAVYQTTDGNEPPVFGNTSKTVPFGISFVNYKYWMFMYKRYCREVLLYDMRDSTWWIWTMPYPVIDMVSTDRLYTLLNIPQCLQLLPIVPDNQKGGYISYDYENSLPELLGSQSVGDLFVVADKEADLGYALENFPRIDPSVDDFEYEDELIPNTLNGDVRVVKDDTNDGTHFELPLPQSRIDWFLISQKLYLGALNNYKTITGINIVAKGLYEYGTKLAMKAFRNIDHPEESIDMNVFIKDLRTFVQRLNLMHTIFFQYKLSNTDDDKQRQAHIASLCVKYETKEGVR